MHLFLRCSWCAISWQLAILSFYPLAIAMVRGNLRKEGPIHIWKGADDTGFSEGSCRGISAKFHAYHQRKVNVAREISNVIRLR